MQQKRKRRANGASGRRRTNNTGTLEKRGAKWLARWYVYTPQGKRIRKSQMLDSASLDDARARLQELTEGNALVTREKLLKRTQEDLEGVRAEILRYEDSQPALSLADGFEAYRKSTERPDSGERTMEGYESQYGRLVTWMSKHYPDATEMRHVSRDMAEAFMADLAASNSANTYNKYVTLFKRMWDVLTETARLTLNPWAKVKHKIENKASRRELTLEELRRVCESLTGEMRILFAVGMYTGLRLGDCATLDWGNVDLVRRMISVIPRKTKRYAHGRPVVIPIHSVLADMLSETPPQERQGYVMPETAETYLAEDSKLSRRITAIFARCGISTTHKEGEGRVTVDVGFHSLRHTFVSLSANAGVPLAIVQAIVGHTNPAMTRHYFHESETALQSAVAALPSITVDVETTETVSLPKSLLKAVGKLTRAELLALQAEIAKRL